MMSRVQKERVISSSIIDAGETITPEETVKYVEVPVVEEIVKHVPRKEIVEIEKRVPKYEYEFIERIVEIPQVQTINKQVEVPEVREVIKHVRVKQIVEVPKEVIKYVPKIETRVVEQEVEVPGEMVEIPKPYLVENQIIVPRYIDTEVPTVVAQKVQPVVSESATEQMEVDLKQYCPYLVPVDLYIPRPVQRNLVPAGKQEEHRVVDVPPAQFNSLVKNLNPHVSPDENEGLFRKTPDGSVPMLHGLGGAIVPPVTEDWQKSMNAPSRGLSRTTSTAFPSSSRSFRS
eukprot:Lankesteria_metandrocarpae@DN791_c0_g1_i1.p1